MSDKGDEASNLPLIYIVDDEPMVLELAELILGSGEYRTRKFRDPELAFKTFVEAEEKPDLIVTDYAMSGMDGLALMDSCRNNRPGQKVLLMSGTVSNEIFGNRQGKPDAFVPKPFDVVAFAAMVKKVLLSAS